MSNAIATTATLPTILWRQNSLVDTELVYYYNSKLMELTITNSDLTYLEFGEMCEHYSDHTQKSSYSWELWSTTDRLTDKQLAELIAGELYLQNKSKPETIDSFKMYGSNEAIRRLTAKRYNRIRAKHPRNKNVVAKARKHYKNGMRLALESLEIIERLLCKLES